VSASDPTTKGPANDFASQAERDSSGLLREMFGFLLMNKKWWLLPIVIALLLIGMLVLLGGTAVAPFIYTLF